MDTCMICNQNGAVARFSFNRYRVYACVNCGFRWLSPQPTDEELSKIYSEQYFLGEGDAEITNAVNRLKRTTAKLYLQQLETEVLSSKGLSLLEIGCGMGDFLLEAQLKGFKVSGLEITEHLAQLANQRLGTTCVEKGYIETSTYTQDSFDVISFFDVIEHVHDPLGFMKKVNWLLKKNGKIFIVTPSLDNWSARLLGKHWMEYKVEHLSYFNKIAMKILLEKTGFQNIRFCSNYKILSFDYISRHFARFPVKGLSPLVNFARKIVPDRLADVPLKVNASGMAVIGQKCESLGDFSESGIY